MGASSPSGGKGSEDGLDFEKAAEGSKKQRAAGGKRRGKGKGKGADLKLSEAQTRKLVPPLAKLTLQCSQRLREVEAVVYFTLVMPTSLQVCRSSCQFGFSPRGSFACCARASVPV